MSTDNEAAWQRKVDQRFPSGAVAINDAGVAFPITWLRVIGMAGLDPVLNMYVAGGSLVLDHRVLTSWNQDPDDSGCVLATFANGMDYRFYEPPRPLDEELKREGDGVRASFEEARP